MILLQFLYVQSLSELGSSTDAVGLIRAFCVFPKFILVFISYCLALAHVINN